MSLQRFLMDKIDINHPPIIAVACAEDEEVIKAIDQLTNENFVSAILIGDKSMINEMLKQQQSVQTHRIIDSPTKQESVMIAIDLIRRGQANMLMKGQIDTSVILKAVLDKEKGLRKDSLLSHVSIAQLDDRTIVFSDGAMNIAPSIQHKQTIIDQCCEVADRLQLPFKHVGILCAVEKVSEKMPCTLDAIQLKHYVSKHHDAIIDGPFALDNALSKKAASIKNINSPIAGDVNILIMPNIEAGNVFYKTLTYIAKKEVAGIIMGAKVPIIITSRADDHQTKIHAILLACACC